ncbi:hypothetical protein J132_02233 [Termitomyces sp. J132]|nr:hypothetical protein J132_02233 [Termitomyces sp. J132]
MISLFEHAGIQGDKERKKRILEYVDAQTEQEWLGFDSFGDDYTWSAFEKEIKESYPEAVDDTGSVANLDRICREHARLSRNDTTDIHSLIRKFRAEAKKLADVTGNGSLVDKFLGCFTPAFGDVIKERLISRYGHYKDPARNRHKDNKYDLSEVLTVVGALIDGATIRSPREEKVEKMETSRRNIKEEKVEEKMAHLQDAVVIIRKQMGSIQSTMQALQAGQLDMHNTFLNTKESQSIRTEGPPTLPTSGRSGVTCFYCWQTGHRISECEVIKGDVQKGWIILLEGRARLPNGAPLPRDPASISPHARLVQVHDKQVSMYFGWPEDEPPETVTYSTYVNLARDTRDDMLECIQHKESDCLGDLEKGFNKMAEMLSMLVNTRNTASPEGQKSSSKDF